MSILYFLVGPTATGKSAVAQHIAEEHGFEILSADSMLVYRGMDIGTAKPSVRERAGVVYHGVDVVSPSERFSVGDFMRVARKAVDSALKSRQNLVVAGGTGLYLKCLTEGLSGSKPPDPGVRAELQKLATTGGVEALQKELLKKNRELYESVRDKKNPRRLIRALEQAESADKFPAGTWDNIERPVMCGLMMPSAKLYKRIARRVDQMYESGLLEETEKLCDAGIEKAPTALQGIGYAEAISYIKGLCTLEEAKDRTVVRTRRLAKRQMTWFRHQADVRWIEIDDGLSVEDVAALVLEKWRKHGGMDARRVIVP